MATQRPPEKERRTDPKVTIVTPSFNQAQFLEQTIRSVLGQDYPNLEYIVVDGGSTDGSIEIIRKYQDRLAWWVSEPDRGQSHAINKGFGHATGEIFHWVNSDDVLMPSAVRVAVHTLATKPKVGVVYGDRLMMDRRSNVLALQELPSYWARAMRHYPRIPQETCFIRRDCWLRAGGLNENLGFSMDYDLWLRLSQSTPFYHIPFVLGAFRVHPGSKTVRWDGGIERRESAAAYARCLGRRRSRIKHRFYGKLDAWRLAAEKMLGIRRREHRRVVRMLEKAWRPAAEAAAGAIHQSDLGPCGLRERTGSAAPRDWDLPVDIKASPAHDVRRDAGGVGSPGEGGGLVREAGSP